MTNPSRAGEPPNGGQPLDVLAWPGAGSNPYTGLLYSHMRRRHPGVRIREFSTVELFRLRAPDIWHMHWPQGLVAQMNRWRLIRDLASFFVSVVTARLRGVCLVWTLHNLESHERPHPHLARRFDRWFVSKLDGAIALTPNGVELACARFPALREKPITVVPHGHYMSAYPNTIDRDEARARLGLAEEHTVLLFIGRIRAYKNVPRLVNAFRQVRNHRARLVVAGKPETAAIRAEIDAAGCADERIRAYPRFIDGADLQIFLNAADLVVLPYRSVLNSGSAILALSFGRPVLVPEKGALGELRDRVGESAVLTYSGELTAEDLCNALRHIQAEPVDRGHLADVLSNHFGWETIADRTFEFYQALVTRAGQGKSRPPSGELATPDLKGNA